jgi:AcrR family transcriptional regulator
MARRRSPRVHERVLEAALALFAKRGIVGTSMDAVAEASGVSKATIYNHWAHKDALCLEALRRLHGLDDIPPPVDSGDLERDLTEILAYQPASARREALQQEIWPHLMAYAAQNRDFGDAWRRTVMKPARDRIATRIARAITRGEVPPDVHLDFAVAMLIGPLMYRHAFAAVHGGLPENTPALLAGAFCRAFAAVEQPPAGVLRPRRRPTGRRR